MSGFFDDVFGGDAFNTSSNYDIFSTPTVEQGGYDSNFNYGADPEGITQGGSAVGATGGVTSTAGGGATSALTDLLKKYGLPALLAGLSVVDRQKATGGGYGKAYKSPSPLTRTISQGKYGPIAKYAAEGGIIQGYAGGGQLSSDQLSPDVASMVGAIENQTRYGTPAENQRAVNALMSALPLGSLFGGISGLAQKASEGDYSGAARSMVPGINTLDALKSGDVSSIASGLANLIPGVSAGKAIYNLFNSPPSQSSQAADYASAFGNPEGTTPSSQAVQAADYASAFGNPETGRDVPPQVLNEITSTLANYDPQDINAAVMATIPEINTTQVNSTQGADLGAFNQGDNGAAPESSYGYAGPDYGYGGYDGGAGIGGGGNFYNDSSGPGEGGGGGGMWNGEYINRSSYAQGGIAGMAKGRFLRGPGDGVSDSIPATIDGHQPAALADGEFVIPARVVSELGNGSSEAGARKLHAMMVRIQQDRRGAKDIAANTKVDRHLPA